MIVWQGTVFIISRDILISVLGVRLILGNSRLHRHCILFCTFADSVQKLNPVLVDPRAPFYPCMRHRLLLLAFASVYMLPSTVPTIASPFPYTILLSSDNILQSFCLSPPDVLHPVSLVHNPSLSALCLHPRVPYHLST
jgi:hypothetical protein